MPSLRVNCIVGFRNKEGNEKKNVNIEEDKPLIKQQARISATHFFFFSTCIFLMSFFNTCHCFPLFLWDTNLRKGTTCPFCVPIHAHTNQLVHHTFDKKGRNKKIILSIS